MPELIYVYVESREICVCTCVYIRIYARSGSRTRPRPVHAPRPQPPSLGLPGAADEKEGPAPPAVADSERDVERHAGSFFVDSDASPSLKLNEQS